MMKKLLKTAVSLALLASMALGAVGCGNEPIDNLTNGITQNAVLGKSADEKFLSSQMDFAVKLFQRSSEEKGENALISPLSVMSALAMTANGARGKTLSQMEKTLGGKLSIKELNEYLHSYVENLPTSEKASFHLAYSIWADDADIVVSKEFLQTTADYYHASVYSEPFGAKTADKINDWVNENTHGMIKKIIGEVPPEAVMFLVNALAFEAEWATPYNDYNIKNDTFTNVDGKEVTVEMMSTSEDCYYLEDKNTTGFVKNYAGGDYSFTALLPDEDIAIEDYVASLTGEKLTKLWNNKTYAEVITQMPKFEFEYDIILNDVLKAMGITNAFDNADLSGLGTSNDPLYISYVQHKTFIKVDGLGTKAGAATVVAVYGESASTSITKPKVVILNRPFVYMIVHNETGLPLFIGAVTNLNASAN